jgi:hypothetical protein
VLDPDYRASFREKCFSLDQLLRKSDSDSDRYRVSWTF